MDQSDKSDATLDLDDRYGRKRKSGPNSAKFFLVLLILALFGWFIWAATYHSDPQIKVNLISFKAASEKSMGINFQVVRRDPNQPLDCQLVAVDIDKYVVGEITFRVAAGNKTELISTVIPTRSKSVSASVTRCVVAQ